MKSIFLQAASLVSITAAQASSLVTPCEGYSTPDVVCIDRYGSVMPGNFIRRVRNVMGDADTYGSTSVPDDPSFSDVANATFVVWDRQAAPGILGKEPQLEFMFEIPMQPHEAPVYVPTTNELYFTRLQKDYLPQLVVNLAAEPPTLSEKTANPPIYAPSGSRYRNGSIIFCSGGLNDTVDGKHYRPGIIKLDPRSGKSETLLNNYYGYFFNMCDDLDIDSDGNIWFTDPQYSWPDQTSIVAPQLGTASYKFNPETGVVQIVEDTLVQPNGINFSPDEKTLYLSDTGSAIAIIDENVQPVIPLFYNSTGKRTLYAFDVTPDKRTLLNKRPIYHALEYAVDGLKVAENGMVITATGRGVDVLDKYGVPLLRVQTNFTAMNMQWVGPNYDELWIVGIGGVARLKWGLTGPRVH
ncbi:hypothetical protein AJ79_01014 [Helicocarpus griseus UAMH5409]|uniref:SMP-30/Gluconolactonase/LRE-like region domain-containing protein n=1 Tax=Helicocarpus griseus UAMH5409 TaxID=1447875 RepID=A0A2B7Y9W0_9EURO|nr:hypothetical protein AJ79_01014 [Helicocarpus griseus UAMH5409]